MSELAARILARCEPEGDCLVWQGAKTKDGYGSMRVDGVVTYPHRAIYTELVGEIPEGHELDHVRARGCTSRACCNVAHLEAVTRAENVRRGSSSKLMPSQVREIRESSESNARLSLRFAIDRRTIQRIRNGYAWAEAA